MPDITLLRAGTGTAPTSAPRLVRDRLLEADETGAWRFLADFSFPWSYPGGSPVVSGGLVRDITGRADGELTVHAGGVAPTIAGGGLDFTATTRGVNGLLIPAAVMTEILAQDQNYLVMAYLKLPTPQLGNNFVLIGCPMFQLRTGFPNSVNQVRFRRLDAGGTFNDLIFSPAPASAVGGVAQMAFWRDAGGTGFRIRTAAGTFSFTSGTASRGTNNAEVTSAAAITAGTPTGTAGGYTADELMARAMRIYRIGVAIPGRLPSITAALDADWTRRPAAFS